MNWLAFTIFTVGTGLMAFLVWLHVKTVTKLQEMIAAKSYREFQYFQGLYKLELRQTEAIGKKALKDEDASFEEVDVEDKVDPETKKAMDLANFDQDWNPEEIDQEKLKEMVTK